MRRRRYPLEGHAEVPLFQDLLAGISAIAWNLQNKVHAVSPVSTNASAPDLEFRYGANSHRTVMVVKPRVSAEPRPASQWERTYYIHDAQGNPGIKENILDASGRKQFGRIVGDNPDIKVVKDKIFLSGRGDRFKGKEFETGLNAADYLDGQ